MRFRLNRLLYSTKGFAPTCREYLQKTTVCRFLFRGACKEFPYGNFFFGVASQIFLNSCLTKILRVLLNCKRNFMSGLDKRLSILKYSSHQRCGNDNRVEAIFTEATS